MKVISLLITFILSLSIVNGINFVPVWPPPRQTVTLSFNNTIAGINGQAKSITLRIPSRITGQTVMEIAANIDPDFRFTSTYFSNDLGYSLGAIGGVAAMGNQFYQLSVGTTAFPPLSVSPVGYSNWYPFDGSSMHWQLTTF